MAGSSLLRLGLALLLFGTCFAQLEGVTESPFGSNFGRPRQQIQQRWRTQCRLQRLKAMQPTRRVECEAGISEYWDVQGPPEVEEQLQCVGMAASRHVIQRNGLLLPSFQSAPEIFYVVQGRGIQGAVLPGCPETYEESGPQGQHRSEERHQKVREIREGDIVATPAGVPQWLYNNADSPLVVVSFIDVGNQQNQLDLLARRFHLGGNPRREQQAEQEVLSHSEAVRQTQGRLGSERRNPNGNIFSGFDTNLLAQCFNIDIELARRLQSQDDRRERIVRVTGDELRVLSPARIREERQHQLQKDRPYGYEGYEGYQTYEGYGGPYSNGVEETFCSMKMRHNIDRPSMADIFNPRGGRVTTVNSFNLPILRRIQLTAERGVLYKNALMAPHFNLNSNSLIYATRGSCRCQVVDDCGRNVFDGELREGQMLVVPQNYAVVKQASPRGFEWIAVKTNDNALRNPLSGRVSAIRAMPDDVLANAFRISREQARTLKNNRHEVTIFSPSLRQGIPWEE